MDSKKKKTKKKQKQINRSEKTNPNTEQINKSKITYESEITSKSEITKKSLANLKTKQRQCLRAMPQLTRRRRLVTSSKIGPVQSTSSLAHRRHSSLTPYRHRRSLVTALAASAFRPLYLAAPMLPPSRYFSLFFSLTLS